jgi:ABC-type multidrug transport system fused ATPase/permease subunit
MRETFSKVLSYPVSFFKKEGLGKITYAATNGPNILSGVFGDLSSVFAAPMITIASLYFLFKIS